MKLALPRAMIPGIALMGAALLTERSLAEVPAGGASDWPRYSLQAESIVPLGAAGRGRFDASGLLRTRDGDLLVLNDMGPTLYRIEIPPGGQAANLVPLTTCFTFRQLASLTARRPQPHLDCEGIAQDDSGRFYICEEYDRWILRCDPKAGTVERLAIDWSPVTNYFSADRNASFEGIAVGDGRLYVANERNAPVIIVVNLKTLKVIDRFVVIPQKPDLFGTHYSDLSWRDGLLFVLCRQHRVVLEVDPRTRTVVAEFDYGEIEGKLGYKTYGIVGLMEGLAVDADYFWLAIDNNGIARQGDPKDTRPVLVKCPRPGRANGGSRRSSVATPPPADKLAR
jgi:uncharacterized protein YjiK